MRKVYVGLGSNLGNRKKYLVSAITRIDSCREICVVNKSSFYETKPVGGPPQPDYVNCVIELDTEIEPQSLLEEFKGIELELGRKPGTRWGPRVIDIDILLYGNKVINDSNLKIPHESMHKRIFVLEPLCEISPDFKHPVLRKTIFELLKDLKVPKKR
jgi:2-amino-4-hydroxy-6-hydroxymethyldihydropteridine diphosphokinase